MIHGPEKFKIPVHGPHKVEFIVNWTKATQACEFVKMRIDGRDDILIPVSSFIRTAMFLANEEQQDALIPMTSVKVKQVRKQFNLKLTKDMKAGEELVFNAAFDVPIGGDTLSVISKTNSVS